MAKWRLKESSRRKYGGEMAKKYEIINVNNNRNWLSKKRKAKKAMKIARRIKHLEAKALMAEISAKEEK